MKTSRHPPQPTPIRNTRDMRPLKPPDRPLVPYMRFSKKMWSKIHQENPELPLLEIGKIIGQLWREAPDAEKSAYQQEYEAEKIEYERNVKAYQAALTNQHTIASRTRASTTVNDGTAAIQAVDEEDPMEMTKKRLSAIRFDRDSRLMAELFTTACLPDTRTMVPQNRIDLLKKQATSLSTHQNKLNSELDGLEEKFQKRKRDLEENSEKFNQEIKKLREERPSFTEEKYREFAQLWMDYMREQYAEHKADKEKVDLKPDEEETAKTPNDNVESNAMEVDGESKEPEKEENAADETNAEETEEQPTENNDEEKTETTEEPEASAELEQSQESQILPA
ncbi:HMG box [Aphelenchoides bicaudatus]|nr:HMG box [Aphelenchoides bicaudatus]